MKEPSVAHVRAIKAARILSDKTKRPWRVILEETPDEFNPDQIINRFSLQIEIYTYGETNLERVKQEIDRLLPGENYKYKKEEKSLPEKLFLYQISADSNFDDVIKCSEKNPQLEVPSVANIAFDFKSMTSEGLELIKEDYIISVLLTAENLLPLSKAIKLAKNNIVFSLDKAKGLEFKLDEKALKFSEKIAELFRRHGIQFSLSEAEEKTSIKIPEHKEVVKFLSILKGYNNACILYEAFNFDNNFLRGLKYFENNDLEIFDQKTMFVLQQDNEAEIHDRRKELFIKQQIKETNFKPWKSAKNYIAELASDDFDQCNPGAHRTTTIKEMYAALWSDDRKNSIDSRKARQEIADRCEKALHIFSPFRSSRAENFYKAYVSLDEQDKNIAALEMLKEIAKKFNNENWDVKGFFGGKKKDDRLFGKPEKSSSKQTPSDRMPTNAAKIVELYKKAVPDDAVPADALQEAMVILAKCIIEKKPKNRTDSTQGEYTAAFEQLQSEYYLKIIKKQQPVLKEIFSDKNNIKAILYPKEEQREFLNICESKDFHYLPQEHLWALRAELSAVARAFYTDVWNNSEKLENMADLKLLHILEKTALDLFKVAQKIKKHSKGNNALYDKIIWKIAQLHGNNPPSSSDAVEQAAMRKEIEAYYKDKNNTLIYQARAILIASAARYTAQPASRLEIS